MRMLVAALTGVVVLSAANPAAAVEYPWCADYNTPDGSTNCGFVTIEQCRAAISGVGGNCRRNLFYVGEPAPMTAAPRRRP